MPKLLACCLTATYSTSFNLLAFLLTCNFPFFQEISHGDNKLPTLGKEEPILSVVCNTPRLFPLPAM